jgi:hypothetical protein
MNSEAEAKYDILGDRISALSGMRFVQCCAKAAIGGDLSV